jgi:hypothetical protein
MAEERISLGEVIRWRAWRLAPGDVMDRARALPCFEEDGNGYECLLEVDEAAALRLRTKGEADIARLVGAGRLRFVRGGRNVSVLIRAG